MEQQQQTQFFNAVEVIKGIDNKPMSPKEGMPPSFRWIVYTETNRRYSFFAPTADRSQTFLKGLDAPHTVDITYFITPGINPVTKQPTTYNNIAGIERVMQPGDASPAMDAAITQQEQQALPPVQHVTAGSIVEHATGAETPPPQTADEPGLVDFPPISTEPVTEPQTMMADPVTRGNWGIAIFEEYSRQGLIKTNLTKPEKELEDAIMAKAHGIIAAMDSMGE